MANSQQPASASQLLHFFGDHYYDHPQQAGEYHLQEFEQDCGGEGYFGGDVGRAEEEYHEGFVGAQAAEGEGEEASQGEQWGHHEHEAEGWGLHGGVAECHEAEPQHQEDEHPPGDGQQQGHGHAARLKGEVGGGLLEVDPAFEQLAEDAAGIAFQALVPQGAGQQEEGGDGCQGRQQEPQPAQVEGGHQPQQAHPGHGDDLVEKADAEHALLHPGPLVAEVALEHLPCLGRHEDVERHARQGHPGSHPQADVTGLPGIHQVLPAQHPHQHRHGQHRQGRQQPAVVHAGKQPGHRAEIKAQHNHHDDQHRHPGLEQHPLPCFHRRELVWGKNKGFFWRAEGTDPRFSFPPQPDARSPGVAERSRFAD
jgi:hypothetical protein